MKKITIISAMLLSATILFGQYKIDTSFYSAALDQVKMVDIYFPPGYDENPSWDFPVIYYLHGWGGNQNAMNTMISFLNQMINDSIIEPVIMVGADNSPAPLGGSVYVNSVLWGDYEDYNVNDLVQWIDASFRTIPDKHARGLLGQSMGGYGAFRYGILHHDIYNVIASHAGPLNFNDEFYRAQSQQAILSENNPGPPYFYNFGGNRPSTILSFLVCGVCAPDTNTPQTYINPPIVQYLLDESGNYIDSVLAKQEPFDIIFMIDSLSQADSVRILLGDGSNDGFFLYPGTLALKDTLDLKGLQYEFFDHTGGHNMPTGFKNRSLIFLDSLLMSPGVITNVNQVQVENTNNTLHCYPNPCRDELNIEFVLIQQDIVRINLYNMMGMKVDQIFYNRQEKGTHKLDWDTHHLHSGIYLINLRTSRGTKIQKIIIQ